MAGSRRWRWAAAALFLAMAPAAAQAEFDYDKVEPSVVRIIKLTEDVTDPTRAGGGTGFVIDASGYVATNDHVVRGATKLLIPDGGWDEDQLRPATVVWQDEDVDLAVIKVEGLKRPALPLAEIEPKKGTGLYVVGFPGRALDMPVERWKSLQATVTAGVVGNVFDGAQSNRPEAIRRMIQHNADTNPGNSGGPYFNACNQVIGVHTYGSWTILEIKEGQNGQKIAMGTATSGLFYGTHIAVLIRNLRAHGIPFTAVAEPCVPAPVALSRDLYLYTGAVALLALLAVVLALRRPRQVVAQAVESYSHWLRRSAGGEGRRPASGEAVPGDWLFTGTDRLGRPIRLVVAMRSLARDDQGLVIGRSRQIADVVLGDPSVSRRHARVVRSEGGIALVDLKSKRGTWVGSTRLEPYAKPMPVEPGTFLQFGTVTLEASRA
jgi:hypothetical protein